MDPFDNVVLGDKWRIIDDAVSDPSDIYQTVKRAVSPVGKKFRNVPYNLLGNNCGNFVAYAKYGRGDLDRQFVEIAREKLHTLGAPGVTPLVEKVYALAAEYYMEHEIKSE